MFASGTANLRNEIIAARPQLPGRRVRVLYQFALLATYVRRCRGFARPSKHLIRLAFTMRSTPHNVGHHESRFPSLGISAARTVLLELATKNGRGFPRPFCIADEAEPYSAACGCALETLENSFRRDQARSKRSSFITLVHAATKSFTNFSFESAHA